MPISYDPDRGLFLIHTRRASYACALRQGKLLHAYWGPRLAHADALDPLLATLSVPGNLSGVHRSAKIGYEYRVQEPFDFAAPSLLATFPDGVQDVRLSYVSHSLGEEALDILLRDEHYALEVTLQYRLYGALDLISRRAVIRNAGEASVVLDRLHSATVYLPHGRDYRLTHLAGDWGAEYQRQQAPLTQAMTVIGNCRGTCGAHQQVPFFALDPDGASTETEGEVYYGLLHWSGDFDLCVEKLHNGQVTVTGGVSDHRSRWTLGPGEAFETPLFTLGYSPSGFEKMTETLYDWQLDFLCPQTKAHAPRPIIYNSWYPYEFDVHEENILGLIDKAAKVGAELFVIDDGWMPKRVDSHAGLGDWVADPVRFPRGLGVVADACHERGMLFGLWVEPEMVNPDSDLYRAHPDWVLSDPTRPRTEQRNQLVLDLAKPEVLDFALDFLDRVIEEYKLDYLKWDMNRYFTERGTDPSMPIAYIQNLYKIWAHLNEKHPNVLFENCASGGGRSDFGMVPYADRINRSDNADPVDVMRLHEGFSMLFLPKTAGGAGNIATSPNHVNGRATPLSFRIHWGMTGSMSIGIDLLKAPQEELDALREATQAFKAVRADLQDAYVYRIASAADKPYAIFQYVKRDRTAFGLFAFAHGMRHWDKLMPRFRLRGLDPDALYADEAGQAWRGEALMAVGIPVPLKGDCDSRFLFFRKQA